MALARNFTPLTVTVLLVISGCGGDASGDSPEPGKDSETTCGDFLAMNEADRTSLAENRTIIVGYDSEGAHVIPRAQAFADACSDAGEKAILKDVETELEAASESPSCADYLNLDEPTREEWLSALRTDPDFQGTRWPESAEDLTRSCADFGDELVIDASESIADMTTSLSWSTETKLGYTTQVVVKFFEPRNTSEGHPDDPEFGPGTACDYDTETDLAIPITLVVTNTSEQPAITKAGFKLVHKDYPQVPFLDPRVETDFSDGADCSVRTTEVTVADTRNVVWDEPLEPKETRESQSFIIVEDYYSPKYPDGANNELAKVTLIGPAGLGPDEDDPYLPGKTVNISLDQAFS